MSADKRICRGCGQPLPASSRPNRLYHDGTCRKAGFDQRRRERQAAERSATARDLETAIEVAVAEPRLVARVAAEASRGNWRAAAWLLERRHPERWAARPRSMTGPVEAPPAVIDDPFAEVDQLAERRRRRELDWPPPAT